MSNVLGLSNAKTPKGERKVTKDPSRTPSTPHRRAPIQGSSKDSESWCVLCLSNKALSLPLCGHPLCESCRRGLSRLERHLEDEVCEMRAEQFKGRDQKERKEERERSGSTLARYERKSPTALSSMEPLSASLGTRSEMAEMLKSSAHTELLRQVERRDKAKEKERHSTGQDEGVIQTSHQELATILSEKVRLFCCPICHKWDITRIHHYISATIKYVG